MASNSYYNRLRYSNDQPHLLSSFHSMPSPGFSSGHPSPLKPLHLLKEGPTGYQHTATFHDYENLKEASYEDIVHLQNIPSLYRNGD
jgi:hypothetical protein